MPYTRLFPVEVKSAIKVDDQRMIRIITANVLTPNRNAKALIEIVRENSPDILVTLESDAWWQARLDALEPDYPYTIKCPLDKWSAQQIVEAFPWDCLDRMIVLNSNHLKTYLFTQDLVLSEHYE